MKILNYVLILAFSLTLLSCGGGGSDSDKTKPVIKFTSPSTDAANPTKITSGQTVTFKGDVSDNDQMQSIVFSDLIVRAKTVSDFVEDFNKKLDSAKPNSNVVVDESKKPVAFSIETLAGAPAGEYTLTCTVTDKSNNQETVTFYIKVE